MIALKLILLSIPAIIYCQGNKDLILCDVTDFECLSRAALHYLRFISQGIPEYDIKPYDPLIVESTQIAPFPGVKFHLKFVNITGIRNHELHQFKFNRQDATLATKGDINVVSDFIAEVNNTKYRPVKLTIKSTVIGTANYNHSLATDDKGVEHFVIGPETISCQVLGEPQFSISDPTLANEIRKDKTAEQIAEEYHAQGTQIKETLVCTFVEQVFKSLMQSLRVFAERVPKDKFLKSI